MDAGHQRREACWGSGNKHAGRGADSTQPRQSAALWRTEAQERVSSGVLLLVW
jgi:hypothetical protein